MFVVVMAKRNFGCIQWFILVAAMALMLERCANSRKSLSKTQPLLKGHGMNTSAKSVRFDDNSMLVELSDGRTLGIPLVWFPRLLHATPEQRQKCELSINGMHWDELDEDISVAGLLAGRGDATRATKIAA
jgi:hypothetical protein